MTNQERISNGLAIESNITFVLDVLILFLFNYFLENNAIYPIIIINILEIMSYMAPMVDMNRFKYFVELNLKDTVKFSYSPTLYTIRSIIYSIEFILLINYEIYYLIWFVLISKLIKEFHLKKLKEFT